MALCRTCDVQGACLAWALDVGDCHGVWGATTPRERRAMLVAWRAEVPAQRSDGTYEKSDQRDFAGPPGPLADDGRLTGVNALRLLEQVGAGSR